MTQLELAEKIGVTDKAVSKWERDMSCPDINSIPQLARILGVSVDELMRVKSGSAEKTTTVKDKEIPALIFKSAGWLTFCVV